jgi:L-amino acid N-acyltransferase YncA
MMPPIRLVDCDARHAPAIREIFNEVIANSTALYEYAPRSIDAVERWITARLTEARPLVGAEDDSGRLVGFASYGMFRPFPAYKYTVEHSVYVAADSRGKGVGRLLLSSLTERAMSREVRVMVGGIDAANVASIAMHRSLGFTHAGTIRQAGWKFGRWLDLEFWQRVLPGPLSPTDG